MNIPPNIMPYGRWQPLGSHWQKQEASSWWDAPPAVQGLCPQTFIPLPPDPWNFWVVCQEKTLALARALQACAESIHSQARGPMQSCQGTSTVHGPIDDHQWGWCYGGLPVGASGRRTWTFDLPQKKAPSWPRELGPQETQALLPSKWRMPGA